MARILTIALLFTALLILVTSSPIPEGTQNQKNLAPANGPTADNQPPRLIRIPRTLGYGYGPYYGGLGVFDCLFAAKRRVLGMLGGLFRPRPWGMYGPYGPYY